MEWQDEGQSQDIEDRRGDSGGGGFNFGRGGIGIGAIILVGIISLISGRNYLPLLFQGGGSPAATDSAPPAVSSPAEQRDMRLISYTLDDAQKSWEQIFAASNRQYRHARLVIFRDQTYSSCGSAQASTGPFYCPADEKIYIDLGFWDELTELGGSTSDFAKSYVITHELGHHILDLAGSEVRSQVARLFRGGRVLPVSERAKIRAAEYFSESFAAYRFEDCFADKDPEGYHIVEAILRLVGKK